MITRNLRLGLLLLTWSALGNSQKKEETPDTIYLPYSETEDVDFTLERPNNIGCYQWTSEDEEMLELIPIHTDFELQCGRRLEIKILPKSGNPKGPVQLTITAENVDIKTYESAVASVEYKVVVVPVGRLEIVADKTEIRVEDEPVMFGVGAYDADGNELDTLDGVELAWFIGANREIATFHGSQSGPIIYLKPMGSGGGTVICALSDQFYQNVDAATMDIKISAPLHLQPDGIFLLEGGEAKLTLYEKIGTKDNFKLVELPLVGESAEYSIVSREEDIARVDLVRQVVIGGSPDEETTLLIKDLEGNIVKGVPIRTARPARLEIKSHPHPDSVQMIVDQEYNITTTIFDENDHIIFPSENILMKTTFGKQFDVMNITVNGDFARVRPEFVGISKIRASLRSTLTPDEDEIELLPHVKAITEFEIYESLAMTPTKTILPWTPDITVNYTLNYKVSGGGKVYKYEVEPESLATVNAEGKVKLHSGPGSITVTAGQSKSMHNNATARVHLVPPTTMKMIKSSVEWPVNHIITIPVAFTGENPDTGKQELFTDCTDINFLASVSNTKDFSVENKSVRGTNYPPGACTSVNVIGKTPGAVTTVTITFTPPGSDKELKETCTVSVYENLEPVYPPPVPGQGTAAPVVLAVGSSRDILLRGGPAAWVGKPSHYFRIAESEDEEVVTVTMQEEVAHPFTAVRVLCHKLGETDVKVVVGNKESTTNIKPITQSKKVKIFCSEPSKVSKIEVENIGVNNVQIKKPIVNRKTGRIMTYNYRDWSLVTTLKDKEGRTFDNTSSLLFRYKFSNDDLVTLGKPLAHPYQLHPDIVRANIKIPLKETVKIHPQGSKGDLDIQVAVVGYNAEVLKSVGVTEPKSTFPSPPEPFQDEDYDYDYDDEGNFVVNSVGGISEEISLTLGSDHEIDRHYDIIQAEKLERLANKNTE